MENVIGLVMAAGTDDRMKSKKSKLAQELYGKAIIKRVVDSIKKATYKSTFEDALAKFFM